MPVNINKLLGPGGAIPVETDTTLALVSEVYRLRAVLKDIADHNLEVGASTAARWALQDDIREAHGEQSDSEYPSR